MRGRVVQVHRKAKQGRARGVPKQAVAEITITAEGVEGDFNRWRTEKANGDPEVAFCKDEPIGHGLSAQAVPGRGPDFFLDRGLPEADLARTGLLGAGGASNASSRAMCCSADSST